jgi:hypothetical protein
LDQLRSLISGTSGFVLASSKDNITWSWSGGVTALVQFQESLNGFMQLTLEFGFLLSLFIINEVLGSNDGLGFSLSFSFALGLVSQIFGDLSFDLGEVL